MTRQARHTVPIRGYADREPTKAPNWHGLVAWDMFLNAVSTGLFLSAALGELALAPVLSPVTTWAYPVAVAVLFGDHLCLILDLGDPTRFHHMLRVFKPTSPMSLGTWVLAAYSVPLTVAGTIDVSRAIGLLPMSSALLDGTRTVAVAVAIPFAFATAAYKGVLFSTTAQPGWRDARWLGGYHIASALAFGARLPPGAGDAGRVRPGSRCDAAAVVAIHLLGLIPLALITAEMWPAAAAVHPDDPRRGRRSRVPRRDRAAGDRGSGRRADVGDPRRRVRPGRWTGGALPDRLLTAPSRHAVTGCRPLASPVRLARRAGARQCPEAARDPRRRAQGEHSRP
ncbi:MAG: NrfD/PsrC family molybdoenzyme membrane anchor subunit [Gemmataceae bacterium]